MPTANASLMLRVDQLSRRVGPGPRAPALVVGTPPTPRACAGWLTGYAPVQSAAHAVQHGRIHGDLAALLRYKCIPSNRRVRITLPWAVQDWTTFRACC